MTKTDTDFRKFARGRVRILIRQYHFHEYFSTNFSINSLKLSS